MLFFPCDDGLKFFSAQLLPRNENTNLSVDIGCHLEEMTISSMGNAGMVNLMGGNGSTERTLIAAAITPVIPIQMT